MKSVLFQTSPRTARRTLPTSLLERTTTGRHTCLAVPVGQIWWGLTDPEALPCWLGKLTSGTFVVHHSVTIQHAEGYLCRSLIQECEPKRLLSMTWELPDEPPSQVRIVLTPAGESTHVALKHDGLGDNAAGYLPGWHTHLLYLEALLLGQPRSMVHFWSTYDGLTDSKGLVSAGHGRLCVCGVTLTPTQSRRSTLSGAFAELRAHVALQAKGPVSPAADSAARDGAEGAAPLSPRSHRPAGW
ncbi:SRPBCC domain-containing protein [Diaminobutyricimonas sp. LJ205]|uniref:SRPBCC family protein n=1 Tax=Diaminobutyricimonas sp. LJ205 TaxID=2683590 RepID=UPI00351A4AE5